MSKHKKNTSLLGLKILSSALLLQQAATNAPAFANGNHRPHLGGAQNADRLQNRQNNFRGTLAHFGVQERLNQSMQQQAMTAATIDLDLSSTISNIVIDAGMFRRGSEVTIRSGDSTRTIQTGDSVTAAEFVSFQQAQTGRGQTLGVNADGSASGGTFSLGALTSGKQSFNVDDVVIPQTVQSIDRIGSRTNIDITGNLVNFGTIAERGKSGSVSVSAHDIVNQSSGLITTVGHGNGAIDLDLTASGELKNEGTISSSGSLSLHAPNMVNSGNISAARNINIDAPSNNGASQFLSVDNRGGTLSALNGDISIREANYAGAANTSLNGGNLLSQKLFLNSGGGTIDVSADQLTGEVVSSGNAVHVNAATDNLIIGTQKLDGDPTYFNSAGTITITGDINVAEDLAIVASQDVVATAGVNLIQARNATVGFNIMIVAGANVIGAAGEDTTTVPPGIPTTKFITFTGASASGGNIDFSAAGAALAINSNALGALQSGGSVTLAAYSGNPLTGRVLLPSGSNINASGTFLNGDVTVIAGAKSGTAIKLGSISNGGGAGAQNVSIITSLPIFSSGTKMDVNTIGQIATGNTLIGDQANLLSADVSVNGSISSSKGSVFIASGNKLQVNSITTDQSIALFSKDTLLIGGNITAPAGFAAVSGRNVVSNGTASQIDTSVTVAFAGNVAVVAGAQYSLSGGSATITGASTTGGRIDFATQPIVSINTTSTASGGGSISLFAFAGSDGTGDVAMSPTSKIDTRRGTKFANGSVTVLAGKTSGTAIALGDIVTSKTNQSGGAVYLLTSDPGVADPLIVNSAGTIVGGFPLNATTLNKADIAAGDITSAGSNITVHAGNNLVLGDLDISFGLATIFNINSVDIQSFGGNSLIIGGPVTGNYINSINISGGTTAGGIGNLTIFNDGDIEVAANGILMNRGPQGGNGTFSLDAGNNGKIILPFDNLDLSATGFNTTGSVIALRAKDIIHSGPPTLVLSSNGGNGTGSPGQIYVELRGGKSVVGLDNTDFTINLQVGDGFNGGTLDFKVASNQTLIIDPAALHLQRSGNGAGASLTFEGGILQGPAASNAHIVTGASGQSGGPVTLRQTGGTPFVIGNGNGQISVDTGGGIGINNGGNLTIASKGDLTVDPTAINVRTGNADSNGGDISLTAGDGAVGNLLIIGDLNVSGSGIGSAGDVFLSSNSATTFNFGGKKGTNALLGAVIANGVNPSNLFVENKTGALLVSPDVPGFFQIDLLAAGGTGVDIKKSLGNATTQILTITAGGSGNITAKKVITAGSITFTAGGSVGGKKALKISTDAVVADAGGTVNLTDSRTTGVAIFLSGSKTGDFLLTSAGDILVNGDVTAKNITLTSTLANAIVNVGSGILMPTLELELCHSPPVERKAMERSMSTRSSKGSE